MRDLTVPGQSSTATSDTLVEALFIRREALYKRRIYGVINGIDGDTVILKVADQVKIRVARAAIAQVEAAEDAK